MIELLELRKNVVIDGQDTNILSVEGFVFEDGKTYLLTGGSGSGKTTLLNIISGLTLPTSGAVFCGDVEINALSETQRDKFRAKNVGYIFQDFNLIENYTVYDNVSAALYLTGDKKDIPPRVNGVLKNAGLESRTNVKVSRLSGGEKQRVALCRAIVKKPNILLADEPTGNLDKTNAKKVMTEIIELAKTHGALLIVVSHDTDYTDMFDVVLDISDINKKEGE